MRLDATEEIAKHIDDKTNYYYENNSDFNTIFRYVCCSDCDVYIGDENDLLNDPFNRSHSLTAFRGYTKWNEIHLFYTRYETLDSLFSSYLYLMCQYVIRSFYPAKALFNIVNADYFASAGVDSPKTVQRYEVLAMRDEKEENLPAEQICRAFTKALLGTDYDHVWWKKRIEEIGN